MSSTDRFTDEQARPVGRRTFWSVGSFLFANGLTFGSVLPRLPDIRAGLGVDLATMGVLLLCGGLGGLSGGLISGVAASRYGSRRLTIVGSLVIAAGVPLFGVAPSPVVYGAVALGLGLFDGITDIGMNMQLAELDALTPRSIVNRYHGAWSVGTLVGAAGGSAAAGLDVGVSQQLLGVSLVLLVVIAWASRGLLREDSPPAPASHDTPSRRSTFLTLAVLALAVAVIEAVPGDWAALFGVDVLGASEATAGLGYVAVTAGMVTGRLSGDAAADRLGGLRLLRTGIATAGVGMVVVVTSPASIVAIVGFFITGLGSSVLFPALYLAAARRAGISAGAGLAAMTTGARVGFLSGPVVVGTIADAVDLRVALGIVIAIAVFVAQATGGKVR